MAFDEPRTEYGYYRFLVISVSGVGYIALKLNPSTLEHIIALLAASSPHLAEEMDVRCWLYPVERGLVDSVRQSYTLLSLWRSMSRVSVFDESMYVTCIASR